ncbi:hypothetical protein ACFL6A_03715 [bacterium]
MVFSLGGYDFDGPFTSVDYLQEIPGIFIISCKSDHSWSALEIGQSENVAEYCRQLNDHRSDRSPGTIYYSAYYMPASNAGDRIMIEQDIRIQADLQCV